jgi:4'-phosphopantetheinyl transferase
MDHSIPLPKLPPEMTVHVWQIDLDNLKSLGFDLDGVLSTEELNRSKRFAFASDASRFRLCRAILRLGLAFYLRASPREIALTAGPHGKPYLAEHSGLYFNVTHSQGLGLVAFTTMGEIGVDVEVVRQNFDALEIANSTFTENERALVAAADADQEQASIFLRFWTRKEAVLKAEGSGILRGLNTVDVSQPTPSIVSLRVDNTESIWRVVDLESIRGFWGAVAGPPGDWSIKQWSVSCDDAIHRIAAQIHGEW